MQLKEYGGRENQMKLQNLKYFNGCPICHSRAIMIKQDHKHTNGYWNEYIEFECGYKIHFSPNFMKEEIDKQCPFHISEVEKRSKRDIAVKKLTNYIKRLDVDEEFKSYITIAGLRVC